MAQGGAGKVMGYSHIGCSVNLQWTLPQYSPMILYEVVSNTL